MIPLTDQLEQARRQLSLARERYNNLYGTYDQPGSEIARASKIYETQKAIVKTLEELEKKETKQ